MVVVNHYFAFSYFATVWYPFSDVSIVVKKRRLGVDIEAVRGCRVCDRMVVEFTTTCAINAYHH
jgi:hypothetical protein